MAQEGSPLIERVRMGPLRKRYPYRTVRHISIIILSGAVFVTLALFCFILFGSSGVPYFPFHSSYPSRAWPTSNGLSYQELEKILSTTPNEKQVRKWSKYYTSGPHLAGKNLSQAEWTRDLWQEFGVADSSIAFYDVYVNYPKGHRLALLESEKKGASKVKYEARLDEEILKKDSTSGLEERVATFHGYSANGNVTAPYVFVNYGSYRDFEELQAANVSLEGKIALIKYGGVYRGSKVERAQGLGMIGAVIYSDPGDDGRYTAENGFQEYPSGPAHQPSSVQRGSVGFLSAALGDPTTPGYPSKAGVPRQDPHDSMPKIPSVPISYIDALPLLKALNGHGPNVTEFNKFWQKGGLGHLGVDYNIGPSPPELTLNLVNEQEYVTTPMWNVIGIINDTIPDEVIVMGNHRDAWIAGGAADPNSGSAAFNEVIRGLGKALQAGWKPLRTIVLASWDGEEYGVIGSTEWVEEHVSWLNKSAVAYINVDVGAAGPEFEASAAPLLNKALIASTHMVNSPNQTERGQTVGDVWNKKIDSIGGVSDFTAFQDFAGIPCIDMGFKFNSESPVYHYHSNYDSFDWMDNFGNPGWHYHVTMAKVWGLLAAKMVDSPLIPFSATSYATALHRYVEQTETSIKRSKISDHAVSLNKLSIAVNELYEVSVELDAKAMSLVKKVEKAKHLQWYRWWKKAELYKEVREVNDKYKKLERQFIHGPGLDQRTWFKHTVFAPERWTGDADAVFPGMAQSISDADVGNLYRWEGIISEQIYDAVNLVKV